MNSPGWLYRSYAHEVDYGPMLIFLGLTWTNYCDSQKGTMNWLAYLNYCSFLGQFFLFLKKINFFLYWSIVDLHYCVSFRGYTKVIQLYIYPFFFRFFSHIGYYIILSRVLCAYSMSLLIVYFIYSSVYMLIPNS